jgi:sulfur relay (sulfurtransferase) complex TusBCD TusD component (DsrE family)
MHCYAVSNIAKLDTIRTYFTVAVVVAGIFTAMLALNGPAGLVFAQTDNNLVVHIKSGNPENPDEVNAATMALMLANHFQDAGRNVTVFVDVNGVHLAVNSPTAGLENATSLMNQFTTNGGSVHVCGPCLEAAGYSPEDVIRGAIVASPEEQSMLPVLNNNAIVIDY